MFFFWFMVAWILAIWLPTWAAFTIVFVVMVLMAGLFAFLGWRKVKKIKKPEKTIASLEQTAAALKTAPPPAPDSDRTTPQIGPARRGPPRQRNRPERIRHGRPAADPTTRRPSRRSARRAPSAPGADGSIVRDQGPWAHRDVSANGIRFHIVEAGIGPAGGAAARVRPVLAVLALSAPRAGAGRLPGGRAGPARLRRHATRPSAGTTPSPWPTTSPGWSAASASGTRCWSATATAASRPSTPR